MNDEYPTFYHNFFFVVRKDRKKKCDSLPTLLNFPYDAIVVN